jgi:hypothetical protein
MTMKNNLLSDRLNEFKNKNQKPSEDELLKEISQKNPLLDFFNSIITLFTFFLKSLIFGYSAKIIFNTNWNLLSILCIGLSISFMFAFIHQLIHNNK